MIRHVVLFRFRPGLGDAQIAAFHAAVADLADAVPAIAGLTAGPALGLQPGGFDYALLVDVADAAAFADYKRHPAHRRLIEEHIRPCVVETARAQIGL